MPETANAEVEASLKDALGDFFAGLLSVDQAWAVGVLSNTGSA